MMRKTENTRDEHTYHMSPARRQMYETRSNRPWKKDTRRERQRKWKRDRDRQIGGVCIIRVVAVNLWSSLVIGVSEKSRLFGIH